MSLSSKNADMRSPATAIACSVPLGVRVARSEIHGQLAVLLEPFCAGQECAENRDRIELSEVAETSAQKASSVVDHFDGIVAQKAEVLGFRPWQGE